MSEKVKRYVPDGFGHGMHELTESDPCWNVGYVKYEDYLSAEKERDVWKRNEGLMFDRFKEVEGKLAEANSIIRKLADACTYSGKKVADKEKELASLRLSSIPVGVPEQKMRGPDEVESFVNSFASVDSEGFLYLKVNDYRMMLSALADESASRSTNTKGK